MEERSCGERNWHGCNIKFEHCATTPKEHFRGHENSQSFELMQAIGKAEFLQPSASPIRGSKDKIIFHLRSFNRTTAFAGSNRRLYISRLILPNFLGHRRNLRIVVSESGEVLLKVWLLWGLASKRKCFFEGDCLSFKWAVRPEYWLLQCLVISEDQWRRYKGTRICFG
jgi:hypothetical protein